MAHDEAAYSDIIVTWLGAAGVWAYLQFVHRHRTGSTLERNTLLLLYCGFALLIIRGFYWLYGWGWLAALRFVPTSLLPLTMTLFGESLMRRHVPMPMKVYVAAGTVGFLLASVTGQMFVHPTLLVGILGFEVSVILIMAWMVWRTDPAKLTSSELRLNRTIIVAALFVAPLVVTDFREVIPWVPRRVGAAAGLIFVYVLMRMTYRTDTRAIVFLEIAGILARAAVMALSFMAITSHLSVRAFFEFFPLSLMFVMLFSILYRLKAVSVENRGLSFLQWLLRARMSSLQTFIHSLRHLPLTQESLLLRQDELGRYDVGAIFQYLSGQRRILSLTYLQNQIRARAHPSVEAAEQLVDLLESNGMNHIGLAHDKPPALLLFNSPLIPGAHFDEIKINLILKLCRNLPAEPVQPAPAPDIVPG